MAFYSFLIINSIILFILPGLFLAASSFPKSDWLDKIILSIAFSLSFIAILSLFAVRFGLVLNYISITALIIGIISIGGIIFANVKS